MLSYIGVSVEILEGGEYVSHGKDKQEGDGLKHATYSWESGGISDRHGKLVIIVGGPDHRTPRVEGGLCFWGVTGQIHCWAR
jgi:hypothetical protein